MGKQTRTRPAFTLAALGSWDKPGTFCDDKRGGLYLQVQHVRIKGVKQWTTDKKGRRVPLVRKYWTFRYWQISRDGGRKLREYGIGPFGDYTIEEAREKAREQRVLLRDDGDPILLRKKRKQDARDQMENTKTFQEAAKACWTAIKSGWKERHANDWLHSLEHHAYPALGSMDLRSIRATHIEKVLQPIWHEKAETASRVRSRIEAVFRYAKGKEWYSAPNPAIWKENLDALLIRSPRLKKLVNHPSLPFIEIGGFMNALRQEKGVAARALEFLILTAARSLEVRGALWGEVNFGKATWSVPGGADGRMKAGIEHRVPLSARAVEILKSIGKPAPGAFIFPGGKPGKPLSDAAMLAVIKRMDADRMKKEKRGWCDEKGARIVPHGFRSTFKTWAQEKSLHDKDAIEFALAHKLPDKVEAAYARGTMLEKRRPLMNDWSAFCASKEPVGGPEPQVRRSKTYTVTDRDPKVVREEIPPEWP